MPLSLDAGAPTVLIRRSAYERSGLVRAELDEALGLTPEEFRVEGDLVALGPLHAEDAVERLIDLLERAGLAYFDDFFELSGNWPDWLRLVTVGVRGG